MPQTQVWDDLQERIRTFVRESLENRLTHLDGAPFFDEPLLGVADGDDPLFQEYKEIIGAFHMTPREVMAWVADEWPDAPNRSLGTLRVVCYALPITEATRASNRPREKGPSRYWASVCKRCRACATSRSSVCPAPKSASTCDARNRITSLPPHASCCRVFGRAN